MESHMTCFLIIVDFFIIIEIHDSMRKACCNKVN